MRRWQAVLVVLVALGLFATVSLHATGAVTAGCKLAGSWPQTTTDVGSSTWVITAGGQARERGLGAAVGTASLSGSVLTITWSTSNG